jgi:hypothetical protein
MPEHYSVTINGREVDGCFTPNLDEACSKYSVITSALSMGLLFSRAEVVLYRRERTVNVGPTVNTTTKLAHVWVDPDGCWNNFFEPLVRFDVDSQKYLITETV